MYIPEKHPILGSNYLKESIDSETRVDRRPEVVALFAKLELLQREDR